MQEETSEAVKAAREAMDLMKRGKRLTKEERKRLDELYARWRGARDDAWQEAEKKIESTLRVERP